MSRRAKRPMVSHQSAAHRIRKAEGEWQLVGTYPARYSAVSLAHSIRVARLPVYAPRGSFETRVEPVGDETGVYARYLGVAA